MISRRNFIAGTAATVAALAVGPKVLAEGEWVQIASLDNQYIVPILWGDGIHNDSAAWLALSRGLPLQTMEDNYTLEIDKDTMRLNGGRFLLEDNLAYQAFRDVHWERAPWDRIFLSNIHVITSIATFVCSSKGHQMV